MNRVHSVLKKKDGAAMITVLCIMALTLILCLALLLNASVMMQSAQNQVNRRQARVLAQSMCKVISENMQDSRSSMATAITNRIRDGSWPDYRKDVLGHSIGDATYTCTMQYFDESAGECGLALYWIQQNMNAPDSDYVLFVTVTCTYKGQACSITQSYMIAAPYTAWQATNSGTNVKGSYLG